VDFGLGDVYRDITTRAHEWQPCERLAAVAGAQVHELAAAPHRLGDGDAMLAEDGGLGARGVVLRQAADRAIERASQLVVEIPGRERRGRRGEAGDDLAQLVAGTGGNPIDDAAGHCPA
jgi:hypothetical protein